MCSSTNGFAVLFLRRYMLLNCTVAVKNDARKCPEPEKGYFSECGAPIFVRPAWFGRRV